MEVLHLAGEELDVGPADADALDVDDDLARGGGRNGNLVDARLAGSGDDEGTHETHGVSDGTRTRDVLDHNQVLYQLSYTHRGPGARPRIECSGCPASATGPVAGEAAQLSVTGMYFAAITRAASVSGPGCGTKTASR